MSELDVVTPGDGRRSLSGRRRAAVVSVLLAVNLAALAAIVTSLVVMLAPDRVYVHSTSTLHIIPVHSPYAALALVLVFSALALALALKKDVPAWRFGLALVVAGALANCLSFPIYGGVPDYIHIWFGLWSPGDLLAIAGNPVLAVGSICFGVRERRRKRAMKAATLAA